MPAYISQSEAGIYSPTVGAMDATKALSLLAAASYQVDAWCNRTFTGDQLTEQVKMAVAMLAEWMSSSAQTAGPVQSERIGDYSVSYAVTPFSELPLAIQMLLASSRIIAVA